MSDLITAVAERLRAAEVPFAVIGAAAMSARGFPRQTLDFDFLVTDRRVLEPGFWHGLPQNADSRIGDTDDPLAGLVRFAAPAVDVVIGRYRWQAEALSRAQELRVEGRLLPVVTLGDLILLKLHAGGYRDAADVRMMLDGADLGAKEHIDRELPTLPRDARRLWGEIVQG
jgi:hypothetical protein